MLSTRFKLKERYPAPGLSFDWIPLVDLCLVGFFFALLYSYFLIPIGVGIHLPVAQEQSYANLKTAAVLTANNNNLIFFEGEKLALEQLRERFNDYLKEKAALDSVLLVKADRFVGAQTLLDICDMAKQAGFAGVQLATQASAPPQGR